MKKLLLWTVLFPAVVLGQSAAFNPTNNAVTTLAATSTTATSALQNVTNETQVRVYNATTCIIFVKFGFSTVTATTADVPIAPGAVEVLSAAPSWTYVAAITQSCSGNVYFVRGNGV